MNFQTLSKVEKYDFYLDLALRNAKARAQEALKEKHDRRFEARRRIEKQQVEAIGELLGKYLGKLLKSFPELDELPPFYLELVKCTVDYPVVKKSLGGITWAVRKADFFTRGYARKMHYTRDISQLMRLKREYVGRISSVMKQVQGAFFYLEEARRTMKNYPSFKTSMRTIALFGFPNVGKTTLLFNLTGAKAEINSYPFTTKSINLGYFMKGEEKIQVIDTPGTLNRFDRMNNIEQQAHLVLKHLADTIIYVFDLTEEYPVEQQLKLYNSIKKFEKKIIVFFSKKDILGKEKIERFAADNKITEKITTSAEGVKEEI